MLKANTRFALIASLLLVPILLIAAKICPQCLNHPEEELFCPGYCGAASKYNNSPAYNDCAGNAATYPSEWECLRHSGITSVVVTPYLICTTTPSAPTLTCDDCGWYAGEPYAPWEMNECFNDDTNCGGNG
jgi:hypothetical protein